MKSIRKSMWGMYWKLHDKRKRLAASLKGYLDGLPPETRRRIVLGMFAAFAVLALYTFGRAVYDIGRNDGSHMETGHAEMCIRDRYNMKKSIRDFFREILELLFQAAALVIDIPAIVTMSEGDQPSSSSCLSNSSLDTR